MSGKRRGAQGGHDASQRRRSQAEILARYWLKEGTSADLIMATRHLLLPLLNEAQVFSNAVCLCCKVGVHSKLVWRDRHVLQQGPWVAVLGFGAL